MDASLAERALESLRDAGERAYALNAYPSAAGFFASAVALAPPGSPEHARLLFKLGRARYSSGHLEPSMLTEAITEVMAVGDLDTAAEAEAMLSRV